MRLMRHDLLLTGRVEIYPQPRRPGGRTRSLPARIRRTRKRFWRSKIATLPTLDDGPSPIALESSDTC